MAESKGACDGYGHYAVPRSAGERTHKLNSRQPYQNWHLPGFHYLPGLSPSPWPNCTMTHRTLSNDPPVGCHHPHTLTPLTPSHSHTFHTVHAPLVHQVTSTAEATPTGKKPHPPPCGDMRRLTDSKTSRNSSFLLYLIPSLLQPICPVTWLVICFCSSVFW